MSTAILQSRPPRARRSARPPILDVLPPALRREAFPEPCLCRKCDRFATDEQRAAYERVQQDWRLTRISWCLAHGYSYVDLLMLDRSSPRDASAHCSTRFSSTLG